MPSIYSVLAFATAITALPSLQQARDVSTVLANLETIDEDTNSLTSALTTWGGDALGALTIGADVNTIEADVNSATAEADTEAQADSADSTTILDYTSGTLGPDIIAALDALTAHQADFASLGLTADVLQDLQTLQADVDALGAALVTLASDDTQAEATTIVAEVDAAFASAEAVFSS
ncbi:hydrophobic surface binding protein A-domain-containing protein [Coniella lustricola]|uniref:Hydrophobic surface binding protein A-domain-containing protein n=1 Tax=Coniella lustricola TaxID=2025994 RepID=A0A2T3A9M6_9PEZI|nr:hydrophobic surface binding protein A-domain-containing protein [Coniella lustricola]